MPGRSPSGLSSSQAGTFTAGDWRSSPNENAHDDDRSARTQTRPFVPPSGREVLERLRRAQSYDFSEPDPVRALHRLSNSSSSDPYERLHQNPKLLRLLPGTKKEREQYAAKVAAQNAAVANVHAGVWEKDWKKAFDRGWKVLYDMDGKHERLDIGTVEGMVRLLFRLPEQEYKRQWPAIRDCLLVSAAKKESLLLNGAVGAHNTIVGEWMWKMLARPHPQARRRVIDFWEALNQNVINEREADRTNLEHAYYMMPIPTNMFVAAAAAYFFLNKPFIEFLRSFVQSIACPTYYSARRAYDVAEKNLSRCITQWERSRNDATPDASPENMRRLELWYDQLELVRVWHRIGEAGIVLSCSAWRKRKDEKSTVANWNRTMWALKPDDAKDRWMDISWRRDGKGVTRRKDYEKAQKAGKATFPDIDNAASLSSERETAALASAWDEKANGLAAVVDETYDLEEIDYELPQLGSRDEATQPPKHWRCKPPALFTPEIAGAFMQNFFYLDMPEKAEEVWAFVTETLRLTPSLSMWTSLLLGYSHHRDPAAAQKVFADMQKPDQAERGIAPDLVCWTILINSYFRAGQVEKAVAQTEELLNDEGIRNKYPGAQHKFTRVYNTLINSLLWHDQLSAAQKLLASMRQNNIPPDIITVNTFLRYYSRPKTHSMEGLSSTLKLIDELDLDPDVVTFTTIFDALLRAGRRDAVERVERIMQKMKVKPSVVTYSSLIHHIAKESVTNGSEAGMEAALQLLRKMQQMSSTGSSRARDLKPTEKTYTALIQGFAHFAAAHSSPPHLEVAEDLVQEMHAQALEPGRIVFNSLLSAHIQNGDPDRALYYFEKYRVLRRRKHYPKTMSLAEGELLDDKHLISEDVSFRTWQNLLVGLVKRKYWVKARAVLEEMYDLGMEARSGSLQKMEEAIYYHTRHTETKQQPRDYDNEEETDRT